VVQNLYTDEMVTWKVSSRNDLSLVMDAVEELIKKKTCMEPSFTQIIGILHDLIKKKNPSLTEKWWSQ